MIKRHFAAAIAGGVAMFIWSAIAHVGLPLGEIGVRQIPNEQPVLAAMQTAMGTQSGMYIYPNIDLKAPMSDYEKKLAVSPSGLLIYHPPGEKAMTPGQLIAEFVTELIECFVVVFLLAQTSLVGWLPRAGFVTVAGVLSSLATNVSYWNWYGFPPTYTVANMGIQIVGFVCAGLVIGRMTRDA